MGDQFVLIRRIRIRGWLCAGIPLMLVACSTTDGTEAAGELPNPGAQLFTLLPSSATGVRFENRLNETNEQNVFTYRNYYNGGGVAIGDLTGDGLPEIVLASNES